MNSTITTYFVNDSIRLAKDVVAKVVDATNALLGNSIAETVSLSWKGESMVTCVSGLAET